MIGAFPAREDEQARMSGARGDFVGSLPRRLEVLRAALRALEEQPRDPSRLNGLLRRLHALGSAARVLGFASVAEALGEAEKTLRRAARGGPTARDLSEVGRAFDILPSLVLGGKSQEAPASAGGGQRRADPLLGREFPVSVLVFGGEALAAPLAAAADLRVECERTEDAGKASEFARVFGPDVAVIDADRKGARELVELLTRDPAFEPVPVVVVGEFASAEQSATFIGLGASRVLDKPVSPDTLRRTVLELRDGGSRAQTAREPIGDLNVSELADRVAAEVRRGLVEATEPGLRAVNVSFDDGADVLGAVWGAVARLRELVTLRSDGNVRFDDTGPEGAVPFAPWAEQRRAGERGGGDRHEVGGVALQGRRVVVADDDPAVVWFLAGLLKAVGAQVFEAHDGERALELTHGLWPDLVVSDVLMPKLDGFSLCHEIKRDVVVRDTPVILLSWKEDLLQRVRELGGAADGYLRKEAAASTVVQRLREVLRPRARVEQRLLAGGEVRGRLDGLTPRLVLELSCREARDLRVSFRDSAYLYEVQVRAGAPRSAVRSAPNGSFERGEEVLAMLLGVSAGRFAIEPDSSACRNELSGDLHDQLAGPVARARAAQRAVSAAALLNVTRVVFDVPRVDGYLDCTPEPARGLLRELVAGASPRKLLNSGQASVQLLEAALSDLARRGAIVQVEAADGVEDILRTAVPPPVAIPEPLSAPAAEMPAPFESEALPPSDLDFVPRPHEAQASEGAAEPEPALAAAAGFVAEATFPDDASLGAGAATDAAAPSSADVAPSAVVDVAPSAEALPTREVEGAAEKPEPAGDVASSAAAPTRQEAPDLGWFSFQLDASPTAPPTNVEAPALPPIGEVTPSFADLFHPSPEAAGVASADTAAVTLPSVPPAGPYAGISPDRTLSSSAPPAAQDSARPGASVPVVAPARKGELDSTLNSGPIPLDGLDTFPPAAEQAEERDSFDPLAAVLTSETPAPSVVEVAPLSARGDGSESRKARQNLAPVSPREAASRPKSEPSTKARPSPRPGPLVEAPVEETGGTVKTLVFAALAAFAAYAAVASARAWLTPAAPHVEAAASVAPVLAPPKAVDALELREEPLGAQSGVESGSGLLELEVPAGTVVRVDGQSFGVAPTRPLTLTPGPHRLELGEREPASFLIKAGTRTLARLTPVAQATPSAGSP